MSSPKHPTFNIDDAFSSNFTDYIPTSPDYVPASSGNTYSSSSNNSFGLVLVASPTLSLFLDDPNMKVMHAYYAKESPIPPPTIMPSSSMLSQGFNLKNSFFRRNYCHLKNKAITNHSFLLLPYLKNLRWEKALAHARIAKLQERSNGNTNKNCSGVTFRLLILEQIIEEIQVRHQADKESLLNAIYELKNSQKGPSDY
ncbi:hypothetical protein Tco_0649412 [Tanacetum coccineum]